MSIARADVVFIFFASEIETRGETGRKKKSCRGVHQVGLYSYVPVSGMHRLVEQGVYRYRAPVSRLANDAITTSA